MTNEKSEEDDPWKIHFSFTGSTTSVLQRNNGNPSNIYFSSFEESQPTFYIYILKQIFLWKDIESLRRIVLDPEEINTIIKQKGTALKSLHEYDELEEVHLLREIDKIPDVKCDVIDGKCFTLELRITDEFDPDHNLRRLLSDLRTYCKTLTKNITRQCESEQVQSTPETKMKSRKRSNGITLKMRPITSYFPKEPWRTEEKQKANNDQQGKGKCSIQIDDDSDFSPPVENELRAINVHDGEQYSIIKDLFSIETDRYYEDESCVVEKTGTTRVATEVADAGDMDVCVTQGFHAEWVTQSFVSKRKKLRKSSMSNKLNCSKGGKNGTLARDVATDEVTDTEENPDRHYAELDIAIREEIRDWCGGETFLTQESLRKLGMVTEQDNRMKNKPGHKQCERSNHLNNSSDNDDDDFANLSDKKSNESRHTCVVIHDGDEESGSDENSYSIDCIKKSSRFRKKCVLSNSKESDGEKNYHPHNSKKQSSKVRYKRVRTYDSDEVSDGDMNAFFCTNKPKRYKRIFTHDSDEESGCDKNDFSIDCIKKSSKFRNKCVLSGSKESDGGKDCHTPNSKKQSSKVKYKRVKTYDSDDE